MKKTEEGLGKLYRETLYESYPSPSPDLHKKIMDQVRAEREQSTRRSRILTLATRWGAIAACLIIAVAVVFTVNQPKLDSMIHKASADKTEYDAPAGQSANLNVKDASMAEGYDEIEAYGTGAPTADEDSLQEEAMTGAMSAGDRENEGASYGSDPADIGDGGGIASTESFDAPETESVEDTLSTSLYGVPEQDPGSSGQPGASWQSNDISAYWSSENGNAVMNAEFPVTDELENYRMMEFACMNYAITQMSPSELNHENFANNVINDTGAYFPFRLPLELLIISPR